MSFLISDAVAAVAPATGASSDSGFSLLMVAAIFGLFYLMLIRPQNKRAKEHRRLVEQLKKGDEIITSGGVLAKVSELNEQFIKVTIADGIDIHVQRNAVSSVLPKGTFKSL